MNFISNKIDFLHHLNEGSSYLKIFRPLYFSCRSDRGYLFCRTVKLFHCQGLLSNWYCSYHDVNNRKQTNFPRWKQFVN